MEIIRSLHIENFRGIRSGSIRNLGDLNIFVGKNNSGKSSILEAIGLYCDPEHMLYDIVNRRNFQGIPSSTSLFYNGITNEAIEISRNGKDEQTRVRLIPLLELPRTEQKYLGSNQAAPEYIAFNIIVTKAGSADGFELFINAHDTDARMPEKDIKYQGAESSIRFRGHPARKSGEFGRSDLIFIDSYKVKSSGPKEAYELLNAEGTKYEETVFNTIGEVYPGVVTAKEFNGVLNILYRHKKVPLFAMGDGFQSTFIYLCLLLASEGAVILCEEPENYQHPSSRNIVLRSICESARKNQLFLTTHSIELLKGIIKAAKESGVTVRFFSTALDAGSGELTIIDYDLKAARDMIEIVGMDLRG